MMCKCGHAADRHVPICRDCICGRVWGLPACTYCGATEPGPMHGVLGHVPSMQHSHPGATGHVHNRSTPIRTTPGTPNYGPALATPGAPARIGSWLGGSADIHVHPESRRTGR